MFDLTDFVRHRPWLYHLTAQVNVEPIRKRRHLVPASDLFGSSDPSANRRHRSTAVPVKTVHGSALVCDQAPLRVGHMALAPGFDFGDLVELLNAHVFFWPGSEQAPVRSGLNHFERYRESRPAILRIRTESLLGSPSGPQARFSRYNSGAPRYSGGLPSPRGPDLFESSDRFRGTIQNVIEVAFKGPVGLPSDTEMTTDLFASWQPLFSDSRSSHAKA